jgi:hypothetical protein
MNIFIIVMRVISLICLGSLMICGLYLGANKSKVADFESAVRFHRNLGIVATLVSAVAILI